MGKLSRDKGKRGEREVAKLLRDHGFDGAQRGRQYQGGDDSPDVRGLPGFHVEVKRVEKFALYDALEQAEAEGAEDDIPVVFHRRSGKPWVVVLYAEDFLELVKETKDG